MLEGTTNRDRIIAAALRLAETRGWRDLSLGEIAAEAHVPLIEFRKEFQSKGQILAAFSRAIDLAVIEKFPAPGPDVARDRLFDVLLDALRADAALQGRHPAHPRRRRFKPRRFARADAAGAEIAILDACRSRDQRRGRDRLPARARPSLGLCARVLYLAGRRRPRHGPHHGRLGPAIAARRIADAGRRTISRRRRKLEPQPARGAKDCEGRSAVGLRRAKRASRRSKSAADMMASPEPPRPPTVYNNV